jgi:lysophospholipase L1-like esterase
MEHAVSMARQRSISIALVTTATRFRPSMRPKTITTRASSAIFFRPCYTGPELAAAVDSLNDMIRDLAKEQGLPLIDAANLMPPELRYFGDASHFSVLGEQAFASLVNADLRRRQLLADALTP